jgi:copper chaperone CopZ
MDKTNLANLSTSDIAMETKTIGIQGMTCESCVETIMKALDGQPGVKEVQIDRDNSLATITFDSRETNLPTLHDVLLKSGYRPTRSAV